MDKNSENTSYTENIKTSSAPEIRFKGFTEDWEQRKFGDVFVEYAEKKHEELPPLTIIQGGGTILREESDRNLQYDKSNLSGYKMVKKDDFILHLRSFEGGLEKANTDGIISPAYHTFHGENTDSRFYYPFFRSRRFIDILLKPHVYGIRDGKSIDVDGMKSIMLPAPSYEEQKKIGDYIENLDHLITLHQRKCEKLKALKSSMLTKMFPKEGKNEPEIRFEGFTGAWEQRKLVDELEYLKDGTHGTHKDSNNGPYLLSAKNIKNGKIIIDDESDRKISQEEFNQIHTKFELKNGDVLLTIVGSIGETAILENAGDFTFQRSVAFLRPGKNITSDFLKTEIDAEPFQKELNDRKSQSAQPGIYLGDLSKIPIYITNKDEQKKIGEYFRNLDNLITLHQRKYEKLLDVKKALLSKMFGGDN